MYFGKEEEEEDIDREGMEEKDQDGKNDVDDEDEEEENKEEHKDDDKEQEREKLENMDKDEEEEEKEDEEEEEKEDEEEEEEEEDVDNEAHDSNILASWETTFVKDEEMVTISVPLPSLSYLLIMSLSPPLLYTPGFVLLTAMVGVCRISHSGAGERECIVGCCAD